MTSTSDYWAHVSAAFVGCGAAAVVLTLSTLAVQAFMARRDRARADEHEQCTQANDATDEVEAREHTEPIDIPEEVDEGKLRVAVRRSVSEQPPRDYKLAEAPTVEGQTLFTYLKHHAPLPGMAAEWDAEGMGVWGSFVETFYGGAGGDKRVAAKFDGVGMVELKRHFLRAAVTLFNRGLTVEQADKLGEQHAHLGITEVEFDAVTEHLVRTLKVYLPPRVYEHVLAQGHLTGAIAALRVRIVRRPAGVAG